MKRFLFSLLIGLSSNLIFAQDIIIKQNGDEIKSKILEITSETIKYKEFEFQDGPTRNINISDVFMVIYENGKREKFTTTESPLAKEENPVSNKNNGNVKERGFIGLGLGANIPVGKSLNQSFPVRIGYQINLINFGYLFSENIGITATWFGASNSIDNGFSFSSRGGLLVGPLFSLPVSEKIEWDIKPMIGITWESFTNSVSFEPRVFDTAPSFTFNLGTGFRFNVSRLTALTLGVDYTKFSSLWFSSLGTIAIKGGFAFRLK